MEAEISYYEAKKNYSDEDLKIFEQKCKDAWVKLTSLICEDLIRKIRRKKKIAKLFAIEMKEIKKIQQEVRINKLSLEEYEDLFDDRVDRIRDVAQTKLFKEKLEFKRFVWGIVIGGVIGLIVGLMF